MFRITKTIVNDSSPDGEVRWGADFAPTSSRKGILKQVQDDKIKNYKQAFTLAEVLITLAIVGVVAALTLPNLIADYKKKSDVVKLKKAYTTLQQAWRRSEVDNGPSEHWEDSYEIGAKAYFEKYWKPYFNNPMLCETYQECGFDTSNPYLYLNGEKLDFSVESPNWRTTFYLPDGIMYIIITATGSNVDSRSGAIYIDLNGGNAPNMLGRDVFIFDRVNGKGILPKGYDYTKSYLEDNCLTYGTSCAAKIMRDGWEMNY